MEWHLEGPGRVQRLNMPFCASGLGEEPAPLHFHVFVKAITIWKTSYFDAITPLSFSRAFSIC